MTQQKILLIVSRAQELMTLWTLSARQFMAFLCLLTFTLGLKKLGEMEDEAHSELVSVSLESLPSGMGKYDFPSGEVEELSALVAKK